MPRGSRVALIIPALEEELTIASVVAEALASGMVEGVVVADNGSRDRTASRAVEAGARVVYEPRRGYGSACAKGIAAVPWADVIAFADADGSDDLRELPVILEPVLEGRADLVVGSRTRGQAEGGALTPVQVFGNRLTCLLLRLFWGAAFSDLGPLRAIRREALEGLAMRDPDFGWTVEMQVKAVQQGLRVLEVPVSYRRRKAGASKVSGTVLGSYRAGRRILAYVLRAKLEEMRKMSDG